MGKMQIQNFKNKNMQNFKKIKLLIDKLIWLCYNIIVGRKDKIFLKKLIKPLDKIKHIWYNKEKLRKEGTYLWKLQRNKKKN